MRQIFKIECILIRCEWRMKYTEYHPDRNIIKQLEKRMSRIYGFSIIVEDGSYKATLSTIEERIEDYWKRGFNPPKCVGVT